MGKIWIVCSGSGGVGKTSIALSIAAGVAKAGKKSILLDASGVSRSCDLILGLESILALDMSDVISGQVGVNAAIYPVAQYGDMRLSCASLSGDVSISELSRAVLILNSMCDILVIDMPTGQASLGNGIMRNGDERLFVVRPDDASIRAVERMVAQNPDDSAASSIILNRVSRNLIRRKTQYSEEAVQNLLDMPMIACIPEDSSIPECERRNHAAIECDGPAWKVLSSLTQMLLNASPNEE